MDGYGMGGEARIDTLYTHLLRAILRCARHVGAGGGGDRERSSDRFVALCVTVQMWHECVCVYI